MKRYHAGDNGVFKSEEFLNETEQLGQTISVSGVGAHHHRMAKHNELSRRFSFVQGQ
jgi:hypothetical protein